MTMHERRPPSYPPPRGHPIPRPLQYASINDGAVWVLGIVASAVAVVLSGGKLDWDDPNKAGRFAGFCVGVFICVFLFGLLISRVGYYFGARSKLARRVGFAFGAFILVIVGVLEQQSERERAGQVAASEQEFINGVRSLAASQPSDELSIKHADDLRALLHVAQAEFDRLRQETKQYEDQVAELRGNGFTLPSNMDSADKIAAERTRLSEYIVLINSHEKAACAIIDGVPATLEALGLEDTVKEAAIQEWRTSSAESSGCFHEMAGLERQFVEATRSMLDFMEKRLGHFQVAGSKIYFDSAVDVAQHKALRERILDVINLEKELQQVIRQKVQYALDSLPGSLPKK